MNDFFKFFILMLSHTALCALVLFSLSLPPSLPSLFCFQEGECPFCSLSGKPSGLQAGINPTKDRKERAMREGERERIAPKAMQVVFSFLFCLKESVEILLNLQFCWFYWFKSKSTHYQKLWMSLERRERQALRLAKGIVGSLLHPVAVQGGFLK